MTAVGIFWLLLALPWGVLCAAARPHILVILADDLGWNDVGYTEHADIPTPHLNQLREEAVQLTQFYVQPKCTPTRAALMTGRYPFKMGLQSHKVFSRVKNNTLDERIKLLPAYMKDLGYHTHMAGKWHLGQCNYNATPIGKGFDTHFGPWDNLHDRFDLKVGENYDWNWDNKPYWQAKGNYTVHLLTNHTQYIMEKHFGSASTKDEPIFMYLPYTVPHLPLTVPEHYIKNTPCNLMPEQIPHNATANTINHRRTLCGMVNAMDEGIGNITNTLKRLGVLDKFIIFFTSDNGPTPREGGSCWPLRGHKQSLYEGGTRMRTLLWAPRYLHKCYKNGEYNGLMHVTDVLPTLIQAAGGKVSSLPDDIDGKGAWWNIKKNIPTWRTWMVYNIFSENQEHAIRFKNETHDFKLIYDNRVNYQPGYRSPDPRSECEKLADVRKRAYFRNGATYIMYNMNTNPEERPPLPDGRFPDAIQTDPAMFQQMKNMLNSFLKEEVTPPSFTKLERGTYLDNNGAYVVGGC